MVQIQNFIRKNTVFQNELRNPNSSSVKPTQYKKFLAKNWIKLSFIFQPFLNSNIQQFEEIFFSEKAILKLAI